MAQSSYAESRGQWRRERIAFIIALVIGISSAAAAYMAFLRHPADRWDSIASDRNYHYLTGLKMGLDLRSFDLLGFLDHLSRVWTWPPLHHLAVAGAVAVVGPRYEVAVLVNVLAWLGTAVVGFRLASRLAPTGKSVAGLVTLAFILASPTHRIFATDFLLETMGAFLTLLAMDAYVARREEAPDDIGMNRWLAIVLTLLFFEKYNYWLLAVLAIGAVETWRWRGSIASKMKSLSIDGQLLPHLSRQLREPLNFPIAIGGAIAITSFVNNGLDIQIGNWSYHFSQASKNLWHGLYVLFLIRIAARWRSEGKRVWNRLANPVRSLCLWHVAPMAIWFLLPKRLGYFIWYISPFNGSTTSEGQVAGMKYYFNCAISHYHANSVSVIIVLMGVLLALAFYRRLPKATIVLVLLLVFGFVLSSKHANRKSRFLHTWIPAVWVLAGVGIGTIASQRRTALAGRLAWQPAVSLLTIAGVVGVQGSSLWSEGNSPEQAAGLLPSTLELSDAYLPWISADGPVGMLANIPVQYFLEWTYRERYPDRPPANALFHLHEDREKAQVAIGNWIQRTDCQQIVLVEIDKDSPFHVPEAESFALAGQLMRERSDVIEVRSSRLEDLGCRVSLWERADALAKRPDDVIR